MKHQKLPDVVLSNDTAWTTLEAITMSKKVLEALIRQHCKNKSGDFYWNEALRCIDLCEKARSLWAKGKSK